MCSLDPYGITLPYSVQAGNRKGIRTNWEENGEVDREGYGRAVEDRKGTGRGSRWDRVERQEGDTVGYTDLT
jgi:hypothetical protein